MEKCPIPAAVMETPRSINSASQRPQNANHKAHYSGDDCWVGPHWEECSGADHSSRRPTRTIIKSKQKDESLLVHYILPKIFLIISPTDVTLELFFFFVFFFSPEIHSKWTPQCPTWLNTKKSENVAADPHPFFRSASAAPHCLRPADTPPINSVAMKRPLFCRRNFLGKWPVDRPSSATTGNFHWRPHMAILPKTKKNSKNSKWITFWTNFEILKNNQKQVVTFQSDDVISLKTSRADRRWNFKSAKT